MCKEKWFYKSKIEGELKGNPRVWHSKFKLMCRSQEKVDQIKVPGIDPKDFALIANAINTKIVKVSQFFSLPQYGMCTTDCLLLIVTNLLARTWSLQKYWRSLHVKQSNLWNHKQLLSRRSCPLKMERGYCCTHTKSCPSNIQELRPISLTSHLSKICEIFAEQWILNDISSNLDPMQFGSRQNYSTTHNLVNLMDFLYKASNGASGSVCTSITTDFAKSFESPWPYDSNTMLSWSWSETKPYTYGFVASWPTNTRGWDIMDVFLIENIPYVALHKELYLGQ